MDDSNSMSSHTERLHEESKILGTQSQANHSKMDPMSTTLVYDPLEYKKWSAKTDLGIVIDAMRNVMRKLWGEENPAKPLDTHAMPYEDEFQEFCHQKLYSIIKGGIK